MEMSITTTNRLVQQIARTRYRRCRSSGAVMTRTLGLGAFSKSRQRTWVWRARGRRARHRGSASAAGDLPRVVVAVLLGPEEPPAVVEGVRGLGAEQAVDGRIPVGDVDAGDLVV